MTDDTGRVATPYEIHKRDAGRIVAEIVRPTILAGGDIADVLVLLESVVTGVLTVSVKFGGDNDVLDIFIAGVRDRMAKIRLGDVAPGGSA